MHIAIIFEQKKRITSMDVIAMNPSNGTPISASHKSRNIVTICNTSPQNKSNLTLKQLVRWIIWSYKSWCDNAERPAWAGALNNLWYMSMPSTLMALNESTQILRTIKYGSGAQRQSHVLNTTFHVQIQEVKNPHSICVKKINSHWCMPPTKVQYNSTSYKYILVKDRLFRHFTDAYSFVCTNPS
jgi:hypothetical protein